MYARRTAGGVNLFALIAAIVCFVVLIVLIVVDSTATKAESVLLPLGLAFGFTAFL